MQGQGAAGEPDVQPGVVELEAFGPALQTPGAYALRAYDAQTIRQPACGQVDLSYFADAAFLGDSLTVGFSDYSIPLGGALICGYTGVGPDAIVNRSTVKSPVRGPEVALDVLAAAAAQKTLSAAGHQYPDQSGRRGQVPGLLRPDAGCAAADAGGPVPDLCAVHSAGAAQCSRRASGSCQ